MGGVKASHIFILKGGGMFKRLLEMIRGSWKADIEEVRLRKLIEVEKDPPLLREYKRQYDELGFMEIVVCEKCGDWRSDLEWRGQENETKKERKLRQSKLNCRRCSSNKVMYPQKIPIWIVIKMALRFVAKGY
jgi:hypothetical protein